MNNEPVKGDLKTENGFDWVFDGSNWLKINPANEPVAWINRIGKDGEHGYLEWDKDDSAKVSTPLYAHPHPDNLGLAESIIKQQQLKIADLEKQFAVGQTSPYLNELANLIKKQTKELSDEEILELGDKHLILVNEYIGCGDYVSNIEGEIEFARAILRKAQEK